MIRFNVPFAGGKIKDNINKAIENGKFSGDGYYIDLCESLIKQQTGALKVLMVTSCTHALEITAILLNIKDGDEIIMPSYTFVSTANAFALRGAKIVFVDIRPDTMNINENLIEQAITKRTKAIIPVHYGGVSCEMDKINEIARKNNLLVIEDAAFGLMATYKDRALGTIGNMGCYSFHETKNIHCGEGGALLINDERFFDRADIIRLKGTNRKEYQNGKVNKYSWVDLGSNFNMNEISAAFLYSQLEISEEITKRRKEIWERYYSNLKAIQNIELPKIADDCQHNAHVFYIKVKNNIERGSLMEHLKSKDIETSFHYVPLHSSKAGKRYGMFSGNDIFTTAESERLLRLPLYYELSNKEIDYICNQISQYKF